MSNKVSVIIPNYNASNYILKCINSVLTQSYENIEIIIIDDGSTDDSWEIIKKVEKEHKNIIGIRQATNMNASIARNKGIDLATGKYVLFLDSDDELFENAIQILVNQIEENCAELALGNFVLIDDKDNIIKEQKFINKTRLCYDPYEYIGTIPNPSNKLYSLNIIKDNNIYFGNVRIGQDLNFFLKYIVYCKKIAIVNRNIYKWRVLKNSMSNSYNFRILDITESFNDVKKFYINNNKNDVYERYVKMIEYRHYYLQMEKQKQFTDKRAKKIIVNFFSIKLNELNVKKCVTFKKYINDYRKCRIKLFLKVFYTTKFYYLIDKRFARK